MIFYYRPRILVVNIVCFFIFIFVLTSCPIINKFHRNSSVLVLYSIGCLMNVMYVFEVFLSLHLAAN